MDYHKREKLFYRICAAQTVYHIEGKIFIVKDPSIQDLSLAESHYDVRYNEYYLSSIPVESDIHNLLKEKGILSLDYDGIVADLNGRIKNLKSELPALEFKSNEKSRVLAQIKEYEEQIASYQKKQNYLQSCTAEYLAKFDKYKKLIYLCTFDDSGNRYWPSWNDFLSADEKLINFLVLKTFFDPAITEKEIRDLARNEPWRSSWIAACKVGGLFRQKSMVELTTYQKTLVSWSILYDNAMENVDFPGFELLSDDALFDSWMEQQSNKNRKKNSDPVQNSKIKDAQEIGIMVDSPEDAKRVFDMNHPHMKGVLTHRQKMMETQGVVKEEELPDVKSRLTSIKNQIEMQGIKKRTT